jgi:signal transduction histidine kinase
MNLVAASVDDRSRKGRRGSASTTIVILGMSIIVLLQTVQQIFFKQFPGPSWPFRLGLPIASTVCQLGTATLVARFLERRLMSAPRIVAATCVAAVTIATAFSFVGTTLRGIVGVERIPWIVVGGTFAGLQIFGLWVLAFRYPLLLDEARMRTLEIERVRQAAELARLREHLQPHFLRNTLNAVAALVTEDPTEARNLLAALGDLLSESIEDPSPLRPLGQELDWLRRYAEILEVRHRDSLAFTWDEDPRSSDVLVPRFLLQPLLENAIHHGALGRDGGGHVTIRSRARKGGGAVVQIEDNGPGFRPTDGRGVGIGLELVRRRIEVEMSGTLLLQSDSSGTRAVVEFCS